MDWLEPDILEDEEQGMFEHFRLNVDAGQVPVRIDKFMASHLEDTSRHRIQCAIKEGYVKVGDKTAKANLLVRPGDVIRFVMPYRRRGVDLVPQDIPLDIVYEDDDLLVVNKPAGMVVHPGHGHFDGTLVNALLFHLGNTQAAAEAHASETVSLSLDPTAEAVPPLTLPRVAWVSGGISASSSAPKVLNLFAYTGAASLAAKQAGADVTHLDSVRQVVTWARGNMEASGLDGIRWVVEDAMKFAQREARRGKLYDGIILDPPAYGHGPDGEKWKLDECLFDMLRSVGRILSPEHSFMVLNLYSNGYSAALGETLVREALDLGSGAEMTSGELALNDKFGKALPLSIFVRLTKA